MHHLSLYILKNSNNIYSFDAEKYAQDHSTSIDIQYKQPIEDFLNNCDSFAVCPGCGLIDDKNAIISLRIAHDNDKCQDHYLINYIWSQVHWLAKIWPEQFKDALKKKTREAKQKRKMYTVKNYPTLLAKHKKDLMVDWKIEKMFLNYDKAFDDCVRRSINMLS